jgi:lipopolysaccharide/colanic/teichoic acid biosynthesis glycosyltransferase
MRKYLYLAYDITCICGSLVAALYLRHGTPLIQEGQPGDLFLLLGVTFATALLVLPLMRTHISMWRYTSTSELAGVMIAMALVVLVYNSGLFLISRLQMMPRSVPPMHWALAVMLMGGSRLMARQFFGPSKRTSKHQATLKQHVIVVGVCHTAELYLQFIKRIVQHEVVVEGFVDSDSALTDRVFQKHKILGTPTELPQILEQLLVHGIHIKQVILAQVLDELPEAEAQALIELQRTGAVELVHFASYMGPQAQSSPLQTATDFYQNTGGAAGKYIQPSGVYPYVKRFIDVVGGIFLLLLFSPLLILASLLVAVDVGMPLIFWQQRPGRYGKPFRLYKFRTMRSVGRKLGEDRLTHKSSDHTRTSSIGKLLRRSRLDELPQLFHIISGKMSFVGPRPLLQDDQPEDGSVRLSVRPGVTGWAQIHGGDALTPQEKLVLDAWYIHHMSLWLDLRILLRTLLVVLKEDRSRIHEIDYLTKGATAHEQL